MKKLILVALSTAAMSFASTAAPADAHSGTVTMARHHHRHHHACTHTSSGSCISGGQFCPQSSYGNSGWDARGRRYVCKGNHTHPHWMLP